MPIVKKKHRKEPAPDLTITVPGDISSMHIRGYPDGHPDGPYRVEVILKGEDFWKRGFGETLQEAIDDCDYMYVDRSSKKRTPPPKIDYTKSNINPNLGLTHAQDSKTTKKTKPARRLIRKPSRV